MLNDDGQELVDRFRDSIAMYPTMGFSATDVTELLNLIASMDKKMDEMWEEMCELWADAD